MTRANAVSIPAFGEKRGMVPFLKHNPVLSNH